MNEVGGAHIENVIVKGALESVSCCITKSGESEDCLWDSLLFKVRLRWFGVDLVK